MATIIFDLKYIATLQINHHVELSDIFIQKHCLTHQVTAVQ